jgi:alkanesulfonate monooxygenase SsuD/methylene tetrahydromethanopterin reductase-like flavin-dependent oxidoreductase (luciferase family)
MGCGVASAPGSPLSMDLGLEPLRRSARGRFTPSARLDHPHVMLGVNVFAADADDEARVAKAALLVANQALPSRSSAQ